MGVGATPIAYFAANQLGSIMNSIVRRALGEATMIQIIRERDRETEVEESGKTVKRPSVMSQITRLVNEEAARIGVKVVDVRIRRADLPRQISEKVYGRMQSERQREAAEFRAQGEQRKQEIQARADRDSTVIRAEAQRKSEELRGEGDADRNRVFAEAFSKDPEFFAFYRSMQAYERGLAGNDTRMILSPTSDFFRYFGDPQGREPATRPRPPGAPGPVPAAPAAGAK